MPALVIVGAQWGDEGKGKVVDLYSQHADCVVRYGGGANAGHTLVVGGDKVVLHLVPSGILHPHTECFIGPGVVADPTVVVDEIDVLENRGLLDRPRLFISERAHVVLPHHFLADELRDRGRGIGTTKRGIGPCYQDKVARRGVRMGDLMSAELFEARLESNLRAWEPVLAALGGAPPSAAEVLEKYRPLAERLRPHVIDTTVRLAQCLRDDKRILFEGAQGALLDVDHGTYPYVTSSSVIAGGACTGAGVGPASIDRVIGITKAYTTRVGGGPFPTEIEGSEADALRTKGAEFGATTGRPRRCGWLDAVALRHAVRINGIEELALTKLDVLAGQPELKVAVAYELDGKRVEEIPFSGLDRATPIYESLPGFAELDGVDNRQDLPREAQVYLDRIEELVGCRLGLISVGPGRSQTLTHPDPFGPP
ncbi:MAG: adenylosuccinate synthase [Myxococcota bacterium]